MVTSSAPPPGPPSPEPLPRPRRSGQRLGRIGEQVAVRHLQRAGYQVLTRNWRSDVCDLRGEIDIVARDGVTLVFCEVKARRGDAAGGPLAAVTPAKVRQLRRLAGAYLAGSTDRPTSARIDVVGVCWPASGGPAVVTHVRDIDDPEVDDAGVESSGSR